MKKNYLSKMVVANVFAFALVLSGDKIPRNDEMINLLSEVAKTEYAAKNNFCPEARLIFYDSTFGAASSFYDTLVAKYNVSNVYLELGEEKKAVKTL
jgi:hypothetical protein